MSYDFNTLRDSLVKYVYIVGSHNKSRAPD